MDFYKKAYSRWQNLAKPLGGLGVLEDYVCKIAQVQKTETPDISKKVLAVFCSDNGIVEEGVSQTDSSVTRIVAENLVRGKTSVCNMARIASCDVLPVDCGIAVSKDSSAPLSLIDLRVSNGTKNFLKEDAMTRSECETAIQNGIKLANILENRGYKLFATGEMGIGNTTTSSAVVSVLLGLDPAVVTGKGAGLSDEGLNHKIQVIREGIKNRNPDKNDVVDVISKVGGFDIATMCGFFIGASRVGIPCVIDGFISSVAALCAVRLEPETKDSLIASHLSNELAGKIVLDELGLSAVIHAGMHLGEGTGCMTLLPMLDMALEVFYKMPTFKDIEIDPYKPL